MPRIVDYWDRLMDDFQKLTERLEEDPHIMEDAVVDLFRELPMDAQEAVVKRLTRSRRTGAEVKA